MQLKPETACKAAATLITDMIGPYNGPYKWKHQPMFVEDGMVNVALPYKLSRPSHVETLESTGSAPAQLVETSVETRVESCGKHWTRTSPDCGN